MACEHEQLDDAHPRDAIKHPGRDEIDLVCVLHALADPVRLEIARTLAECGSERRCGTFGAPVSKSTMTHHFRVLREAGLIVQRQEGTARLTALRRDDLEARFPGMIDSILHAAEARAERVGEPALTASS